MKRSLHFSAVFLLTLAIQVAADDTDIYLNNTSNANPPYMMLVMDYRQDLSGPYCKDSGPSADQCLNLLNTTEAFPLLQALDVMVNGVPTGPADGDADSDGLRDSAADMTAFEASKIQALVAVTRAVFAKFDGIYVGMMIPNEDGGGTILRGYCEFLTEDINADGDTDDVLASIDETVVGFDVNNDGDALDTAVTNVVEAAVGQDLNCDGDTSDTIAGPFTESDLNGSKAQLVNILLSLPMPSNGNDYHESQPKELHYEWYSYINGGRVYYGDQTANNFQATNTPGPDTNTWTGTNYNSPFTSSPSNFECTKFYEIYASSGNEGGSDSDLSTEITADMDAASAAKFEDMVAWTTNNDVLPTVPGDQRLKTWIIQVGDSAAFADDWATAAGTVDQYMSVAKGADLANVQATLEAAFIEALSVSTTFVSASVPVNVFNRIQTLDNFYIALFEANSTERWPGNIKKLQLKDTDTPPDGNYDDIVDANNLSAFNDNDGRIKFEALTHWTVSSSLPPADTDAGEIDGRDGRSVDRGGAGQKIPGFISDNVGTATTSGYRQVYVEPASGSSFDTFDATASMATTMRPLMGVSTDAEALQLIKWARGIDVDNEDGDGSSTDTRPWLMGDIIHSRPIALNYGVTSGYSQSNPNIRLFFGSNSGFFHIIENTTTSGAESGKEVFAFVPRELLNIFDELRADTGSVDHPYGVDGEPVALVVDNNNNGTIDRPDANSDYDEVYVYVGLRRGGKSYYALDASNPNATPTLKWKITKTSGGNFDELGYTFSTPRVTKVRYESSARDVLIFAGGYDMHKDDDTVAGGGTADTEGNAIYIVDARTGALIWKAIDGTGTDTNTVQYNSGLDHSIPSNVAVLDSDGNGITDRLYVGDTSGAIWRVDLPENNGSNANQRRDNWTIMKVADLGGSTDATDLRFFHAPDVVQTRDASGQYDGILIESGDRASPLETREDNYLFLIKDRETASGSPPSTTLTLSDLADTSTCVLGTESVCSTLDYSDGWEIELTNNGEKGLASPITVDGKVYFTSYRPEGVGSGCVPLEGEGALYIVNLKDGTAAFNNARDISIGPGIPPSVTAIGDDTLIIPGAGIIDPYGTSTTDKVKLIQTGGKSTYIIYWRESGVDKL